MPTIYLICGFLGFGKTTYAKKLAQETGAIRFTHDEIMLQRYGRCPDNFQKKYKEVDEFIRKSAVREIQNGKNVILDYILKKKTINNINSCIFLRIDVKLFLYINFHYIQGFYYQKYIYYYILI